MSRPRLAAATAVLVLAAALLVGGPAGGAAPRSDAPRAPDVALTWAQVDAGAAHTCAVRSDGRLFCWGRGDHGELGNGGTDDQARPVEVAGGRTDWATVSAGTFHTCARRRTGRLYCFGQADGATPVQVAALRTDWSVVTAGGGHTCALRVGGRLFCWGANAYGQLGDGGGAFSEPAPVEVVP